MTARGCTLSPGGHPWARRAVQKVNKAGFRRALDRKSQSQQRLRYETMSKQGHGTYYWCLHGLHVRSKPNHWLQLDATAHTPIHTRSPYRSELPCFAAPYHGKYSSFTVGTKELQTERCFWAGESQPLMVLIQTAHQRQSASQALPRWTGSLPHPIYSVTH